MGVLTCRAGQALLGAMLQRPELVGMLGYLEPGDFAWNQHRVLYNAMARTAMAGNVGAGEWRAAVEAAVRPQLSAEYLEEVQAGCPDPLHGPAYGAMVMDASARRTVADLAEDIASEAGALEYDTGRLIRAVGAAGHEMDNDALHLARVAAAMRVHSERFNPDTSSGAEGPAESIAESEQAAAEERILAALIQGHHETRQVMGILIGSAFIDPLRREVFEAVRSLFASNRPIDPLTVDWELTRSRSSSGRPKPGRRQITARTT
jgi:replicative DNA helicase